MKALRVLVVLGFLGLACDSGRENPADVPGPDEGPVGDLLFPDTCECRVPGDCTTQAAPIGVCEEVLCEACTCKKVPKEKGSACSDGDDKTFGDACDGRGVCLGRPASCGNGTCEAPVENCFNCPKDCGCKDGEWCQEQKCQKKPVVGDARCDPYENCRNSPADCACGPGKGCSGTECLSCADYCTAEGLQCGTPPGLTACDCGACPEGWRCSDLNQCFDPATCGNTVCEPSENCGSCAVDCLCPEGKICIKGACADCETFCRENGKECGFYFACDCGKATVCHKCRDNVLVPDCDCLCYPSSQKQCGSVEGCPCGPLQGECPEGKECVGFRCLENCDTLCAGKECGWGEDCICDWCNGSNVCRGNVCQPGTEDLDEHEYNDAPEEATDLGSATDNDQDSSRSLDGNIDSGYDMDWFRIHIQDVVLETLAATIELTGLPEDKDVDLAICYLCDKDRELAGAKVDPADTVAEIESPIPKARCFVSLNLWGQDERIEFKPTCAGGNDDSGTAWVIVFPATDLDYGGTYHLSFHF